MTSGLSVRLRRLPQINAPALPALNRLDSTIHRIMERWPDIVSVEEHDREALIQLMRARVEADRWEGTKLSTVTKTGRVLFESDYRERPELEALRSFYFAEIAASTNATFLSAMMSAYIMSYVPGAAHTKSLAAALQSVRVQLSARWQSLIREIPSLLDPVSAPQAVAKLMQKLDEPWSGLRTLGIRTPHAPGLMDHAHLAYLAEVGPKLGQRGEIDKLFDWLKPPGKEARATGATEAIEAILSPWRATTTPSELQTHLVDSLVSLYGDPRVKRGFPWGSVDQSLMAVIMRWLTGENIRFFLDVVSAAEESHMWAPRREFWLGLHQRKMIDEAWVAFSPEAVRQARAMRANTNNRAGLAYGIQQAGGTRANISLLILKIGRCIVVEGSHNYKVHVFRGSNDRAPKLFQARYDCDKIRAIPGAETAMHLGRWESRVRKLIESLS